MKKSIPFNTDRGGGAKTILSGYYKYGCKTLLGDNYGTSGTVILEIYEYNGEQETGCDARIGG